MPKVHLTNLLIKRSICVDGKAKTDYFDTEVIGLMLEVRKSGNKTLYYRYNQDGKTIMHKLSDVQFMDIDDARRHALKMKKAIATGSLDTLYVKKTNVPTMQAFYDEHYLPHILKHTKSYKSNASVFVNHILPAFGTLQLTQIKKTQIMKYHIEMVHTKDLAPSTANKLLIFISHAYHIAMQLELEGITDNPAKGIKPFEENNERQRFITRRESKRLMDEVIKSENTHLKYIVPMLILSGCRRNEVLSARWRDFDLIQMTWILPITKNGKKRIIPLTPQLYEIYKQIPQQSNTYLFPSPVTKKAYVTIYVSWNTARKKAGLQDVRMHDLRHSFASALVNAGRSLYEVQTLLGHSNSKMTQRYAHLSNEALMSAASCAGRLMG